MSTFVDGMDLAFPTESMFTIRAKFYAIRTTILMACNALNLLKIEYRIATNVARFL